MDEQRKFAILLAATILAATKLVSNHARRGSAPFQTPSLTPISFSRELRNVGRAGQIERIGKGWDGRNRTATGAKWYSS